MRGFLDAVSLLTRIPVRAGGRPSRAALWLPVVGGLIGLIVAGVYAAALAPWPPPVAALLALASGVVVTGALHEDGLADTADACGARADRARTLAILKDPRHGTFGMLALLVSVGVRAAAIAAMSQSTAWVALPAAHAIARGAAAAMLGLLPSASDGLGGRYASTPAGALLASIVSVVIGVLTIGWTALPAIALGALAVVGMSVLAFRKIGGVTGDVLGACEQLAETAILLLCAATVTGWWLR